MKQQIIFRGVLSAVLAILLTISCFSIAYAQESLSGTAMDVKWTFDENGTLTFYPEKNNNDDTWKKSFCMEYAKAHSLPKDSDESSYQSDEICCNVKKIVLKDGIKTVPEHAFDSFRMVSSMVLPDSLTEIGPFAFYSCHSLESIIIPDSVVTLGEGAFSYCSNLLSAVLPSSIKEISEETFCEDHSLNTVNIPKSVAYIGKDAFYGCYNLSEVSYEGSNEQFNKIDIRFDNFDLLFQCRYLTADACSHWNTEGREAVQAESCMSEGYTEGVFCIECGQYISGHQPIPGLHTDKNKDGICEVCGKYACDLQFQKPINLFLFPSESIRLELSFDRDAYYDIVSTNIGFAELVLYNEAMEELCASEDYTDKAISFLFEKDKIYYLDVKKSGGGLFQLNLWEGKTFSDPTIDFPLYYGDEDAFVYQYNEDGKVVGIVPSYENINISSGSNSRTFNGAGSSLMNEEDARLFNFAVPDKPDQNGNLTIGKHILKLTSCYGDEYEVPFEIVESLVEKIEFIPAKKYCIDEHTQGSWVTDHDGQRFYRYLIKHNPGDQIIITYKSGDKKTLTFKGGFGDGSFYDENDDWYDFFYTDDYSAKTTQFEEHWEVGGEYAFQTKIMGVRTSTPVKIVPQRAYGDIDGNGTVEPGDARLALRASVGLEFLNNTEFIAADSDGNGQITPADARMILRLAVHLETIDSWIPYQS